MPSPADGKGGTQSRNGIGKAPILCTQAGGMMLDPVDQRSYSKGGREGRMA